MRPPAKILAIGDAVALLLFAVIGLLSHDRGVTASGLVRDALPVLAGWFLAAAIFAVYRRPSRTRFVAAWAVGVTGAVFVRGLALHRHVLGSRYLTFLVVTLGVSLVLLIAWRAIAGATVRLRTARVPD